MKLAFAVFAIFCLSYASGEKSSVRAVCSLPEDFSTLFRYIDFSIWGDYAIEYAIADAEFQDALRFLQGPEWAALFKTIDSHPFWGGFKGYTAKNGVDLDALMKEIQDFINAIAVPAENGAGIRGVKDFVEACLLRISSNGVGTATYTQFKKLLKNSECFQELYWKVLTPEANEFFDDTLALPEVKRIVAKLEELGVMFFRFDINGFVNLIYSFFGWTKP